MFEFKNVSKFNYNMIKFWQEKRLEFFYTVWVLQMKIRKFSKFISKVRAFSAEILNLDNVLIAANLNRW